MRTSSVARIHTLADIRIVQGRLTDALTLYERGLARATAPGEPALRGVADMHVGVAEILRERGDLAGAINHLSRVEPGAMNWGCPSIPGVGASRRLGSNRLRA